jgi:hypothetical protein
VISLITTLGPHHFSSKGISETLHVYKYSVLLHNNHKSLKQSNLHTFFLHLRNSTISSNSKHLKWVSVYLQQLDGLHLAIAKHPLKYQMSQRAILQCTLERKWSGLSSPCHTWTNLHFKTCWVKQRNNLDMIIQWVASQFLAEKMFSCISLLASMDYKSTTAIETDID